MPLRPATPISFSSTRLDARALGNSLAKHGLKRKSAEWDAEQTRILRAIDEHHAANHSYINEGVKLLELAKKAYLLYEKQKADEKRKLLDFVCSNSTWREGRLTVNFRQPFDMIAVANTAWIEEKAAGADSGDLCSIWLRR